MSPTARPALVGRTALLAAALAACAVQDDQRPPPPEVDPLPARTAHASVLVTGLAEPGARVRLVRDPEIPADAALALVRASEAGGRFRLEVPLAPRRTNTLTFTTVDETGRSSDPSQPVVRVVEQVAPSLEGVSLALARTTAAIGADGTATLHARATVRAAEPGLALEGRPVRFRVESYGTTPPPPIEAVTDAQGHATATLAGLSLAATGRLVATIGEGADAREDEVRFEVLAGAAARAELGLRLGEADAPVSALTAAPGVLVRTRLLAFDAADNPVDAGYTLAASSSVGVELVGGAARFDRPGTYVLTALVAGADGLVTPAPQATVTVAGAATSTGPVQLSLQVPALARSGVPLVYEAVVHADGVPVAAPVTLATDDPGAPEGPATGTVTLRRAGPTRLTFTARPAGQPAVVAGPFRVLVEPGNPHTLVLTLDGTPAPLPATPGAERLVLPGQALLLGTQVTDAAGNLLPDAPVAVTADAGVDLFGATVTAPDRAGAYAISAMIPGGSVRQVAAFRVRAGLPAAVALACPATAVAGVPFSCDVRITDAGGNTLAPTATWTMVPPEGTSRTGSQLTFSRAGGARISVEAAAGVRATADVRVRPGPAATLALAIQGSPATAGGELGYTTALADAFGNTVALGVDVTTDAPGTYARAGRILGVPTPGRYFAYARGSEPGQPALSARQPFEVVAGPGAHATLALAAEVVEAGTAVRVLAGATDAAGNSTDDEVTIRVDGRAPDGSLVIYAAPELTLHEPGTHVVSAHVGDASTARLLQVLPAPDRHPPVLTVRWLDAPPAGTPLKTGSLARFELTARDDRALAALRVRAAGPVVGLVTDDATHLDPAPELVQTVEVRLPELAGDVTVTISVADTSGLVTTWAPLALGTDFHFDRVQRIGAGAGVTVRTVNFQAAGGLPAALAADDAGTLRVALRAVEDELFRQDDRVASLRSDGTLGASMTFDAFFGTGGLALLPAADGSPFLFTAAHQETGQRRVLRVHPSATAPQIFTSPELADPLPADSRLGTLALHRTSRLLYVPEAAMDRRAGRLFSLVANTATTAFAVAGDAAPRLESSTHFFTAACVPAAGAAPTAVFVTGGRTAGSTVHAGVYRVAGLTAAGHVQASSTVTAIVEELRPAAGGAAVTYGPCVHLASGGGRVVYTRWLTGPGTPGVRSGGGLWSAGAACTAPGPCATELLRGTAEAPLGSLEALTVAGTDVVVGETGARRLFRVRGL